ncbi:MAG: acylneuraminate cytidylyltransferase family protein [Desulfobacteraceae bacterium]|nr:MAG: acylneuraminate cytidylyltransferase family protein [Desulfobacteraceae bacterium]
MNPNRKILALVTARGGSTRVPGKNIKMLAGKPLLAWTLEAVRHANLENIRLMVSTEDEKIAAVGKEWGAEVPFLRPSALAAADATSEAVVRHAVDWLDHHDHYRPDLILLLQPTSPFRSCRDLRDILGLQDETDADAVVGVTRYTRRLQWLQNADAQGILTGPLLPESRTRSTEHPAAYEFNGALYLIKTAVFMREQTFYPAHTRIYVMPPERSWDIDNEFDFLIADLLMQYQQKNGSDRQNFSFLK